MVRTEREKYRAMEEKGEQGNRPTQIWLTFDKVVKAMQWITFLKIGTGAIGHP